MVYAPLQHRRLKSENPADSITTAPYISLVLMLGEEVICLLSVLGSIVVGRIAIDAVDVVGSVAAHLLRRVLNHDGWAGDAEVGRAALGGRAVPGQVGLVQCRLDLGRARRRIFFVDQPGVVAD